MISNVKHSIGFFAMTISWTLMNILNSIYLVSQDGKADDSGVIIFWSGLFITIAWVIFIVWPIGRLDHSKKIFKPYIFTSATTLYGVIVYSIIVGSIFRSIDLVIMFLPQAALVGFFYGLSYSLLIQSEKLIGLLNEKLINKVGLLLSPVAIWGLLLWVLPLVAPSLVYPFVPDIIRQEIVAKTIPKFKVGDEIEQLKKCLPGYLDHIKNGSGNISATMDGFAFVIQAHCGKIIRIEYGKSPLDIDGTIYGNLQERICP